MKTLKEAIEDTASTATAIRFIWPEFDPTKGWHWYLLITGNHAIPSDPDSKHIPERGSGDRDTINNMARELFMTYFTGQDSLFVFMGWHRWDQETDALFSLPSRCHEEAGGTLPFTPDLSRDMYAHLEELYKAYEKIT